MRIPKQLQSLDYAHIMVLRPNQRDDAHVFHNGPDLRADLTNTKFGVAVHGITKGEKTTEVHNQLLLYWRCQFDWHRGQGLLRIWPMTPIGMRIEESGTLIREGGGFALRRDQGGRWKLDLHRVPVDHVEKRVRVSGVVVGDGLIDVVAIGPDQLTN